MTINNESDPNYNEKLTSITKALIDWQGPIVIVAHIDPDGDALGSTLALKRALASVGKASKLLMDVPRYLDFLTDDGEISPAMDVLEDNTLLAILDVSERGRVWGVSQEGIDSATFVVNIDHHGTNDRFGDIACVSPDKAATCQMVKDLIDLSDIAWTKEIATPCLTGILTDTGNMRFANTDASVLRAVADLLEQDVAYSELTDRLQWRHPDYYRVLGKVMSTVDFPLNGLVSMVEMTKAMKDDLGPIADDSSDYVGQIRYAEGTHMAIFMQEREDKIKASVRSRGDVSAQAVCVALGGGGHKPAAGVSFTDISFEEAKAKLLAEAKKELERHNLI